MVMQCGVKRKISCLGEPASSSNIDCQQQSLLELSIHKLQEEQAKYGIEPRLLRFVLINNALKALQSHIMRFDMDNEFGLFENHTNDSFIVNTFSHGFLKCPVSPPTPVKAPRFDTSSFSSNHSPLLNSCIIPSLGCPEIDPGDLDMSLFPPLSPFPFEEKSITDNPPSTGCKRPRSSSSPAIHPDETSPTKRMKHTPQKSSNRPKSINFSDSITNGPVTPNDSSSDESSSPSTLSPIDFSNVDVTLYDYDAKASLALPPAAETVRNPTPSSLSISSCAMETFIKPIEFTEDSLYNNPSCSGTTDANSSNSSNNNSTLSSDTSESDNMDEIDRIVSLLMT
jgi:hypothetical protein